MTSNEENKWPDKLLMEYENGRRDLRNLLKLLGDSDRDNEDRSLINSMIADMNFAIDWMKTGREPDTFNGIDRRNIYQEKSMKNMDIYESLDLETGRVLTDDERVLIIRELAKLSPRERQCFILAKSFMMTQQDIAEELGISQRVAGIYIQRAEEKFK
jgi:DNA-binding CsgD family transcriptional regulator